MDRAAWAGSGARLAPALGLVCRLTYHVTAAVSTGSWIGWPVNMSRDDFVWAGGDEPGVVGNHRRASRLYS